jgi:uncharacterized protein YfaS (alpha-2-macroglobulin family)
MKLLKPFLIALVLLFAASCTDRENKTGKSLIPKAIDRQQVFLPVDKGFSKYVSAYTSGIVASNSIIEIHLTPEFAAGANKKLTSGIFSFTPSLKGRTEWADDQTLVFRPSSLLDHGKTYTAELNLFRLGEVNDRLKVFPFHFQTLRKDFIVTAGLPETSEENENNYSLNGVLTTSDYIEPLETENFLTARIERKKLAIVWDHAGDKVHKFSIPSIPRTGEVQELILEWDGTRSGVSRKGSSVIVIPASDQFSVLDVRVYEGNDQRAEIFFSDPPDTRQEMEGLIYIAPPVKVTISQRNNVVTVIPVSRLQSSVTLNIESSVRSASGKTLAGSWSRNIDFSEVNPAIQLSGKGVILPSSQNPVFTFSAANLKAVDLTIIRIFGNNLPWFLQEYDINSGYNLKRFGRPVFRGRVDLTRDASSGAASWKLFSINLDDYIDVEPGILYKVTLSMRRSYALTDCPLTDEDIRYEEILDKAEERSNKLWDDPDVYFDDIYNEAYYQMPFRWEDRNDPCKSAYYSPDKSVSRNILASNLGLIAKMGPANDLRVMVNDLITALPVSETSIEIYDYQMQMLASETTDQNGSVTINCQGKPFLLVAQKGSDRNYLKLNDGNSLSMSSFDVSGIRPEDGIKAFIYGERDVWRPGDSVFLSLFIKDMRSSIPSDHPVQFELLSPRGQRIDNQIMRPEGRNLIVFRTYLPAEAETGNYTAGFRIGGALFSQRVRVETIKPNRLKINLDFRDEILGGSSGPSTGMLNVKWLNGSVAANLKASVEYILKHTKTEFEKYGQYDFDDPVSEFYSETVSIYNDAIDDNGNASVRFNPGNELRAPGMLTAVFTTRVQEKGGDESVTRSVIKYAPYPLFVGISLPGLRDRKRMLFTDTDNEVRIVTLNEKGQPVRAHVEISVYKLSYRWWWESDNENLAWYISGKSHRPVSLQSIVTGINGEGTVSFNIPKNEWGRYLIRATTTDGHSSGKIVLVDWPWEYGMKGNADGATLLSISADKEKYVPGDEISLTFPSMPNARAIVTIENSTGIIDEIRLPASGGSTEVRLKATAAMAPNVYAYVSVIQPHSQTVNDMPVRLYGVIPLIVEDPESRLEPRIVAPDEIRSQKPFEIKVSEAGKREMTYTLAIVDEGLLDITGFRTPDPWNWFFAREALGVQTWDIYDNVLGAYGGTLDRILAVGGDEAVMDKTAGKVQRFVPVVRFLGPFSLKPGKTNTHSVTLPQYTGSVRTMVVAGNEKAFGNAEKSVVVRDPLMVLVTAPRVISPGEKAALPLTIFVQKDGIGEITVRAEGNELISFENPSSSVTATGTGEYDTEFAFTAGKGTGKGKIRVTAAGGGETASYELELEIRSPNPAESRSEIKILKQGEKWETEFTPFGIEGSNSAVVQISQLPSVNLEKRLDYLLNYPYGCTEQIISAAFPQIWLKDLYKNDPAVISASAENIKQALREIPARQLQNGGILIWPGHYQPDNWVTSYAGHFMTEAERNGYTLPPGVFERWLNYQEKTARDWRPDPAHPHVATDQAYRLFTLALAGKADRGAMNRLRESQNLPMLAKWLLAASFASSGRPEAAEGLLDVRNTSSEPEYRNYFYGSELRDKAIVLYTLLLIKNTDQALPLVNDICEELNRDMWFSTQSVAWGLFSYMKWAETLPADNSQPLKVNTDINGDKKEVSTGVKEVWKTEIKTLSGKNTLMVENKSTNPAYINLVRRGIPLVSDESGEEKGISMNVNYYDMELKSVDHKVLPRGTGFMMVVSVTNTSMMQLSNLALSQMLPSGWEIRNTRLFESDYGIKESSFDYRDIRDDRISTFFSLATGETKTFPVVLNASYKGEFSQPSIWCEAMYNGNIYSRIPGTRVKVTGE